MKTPILHKKNVKFWLTLIWVGFLRVRFEVGGGGKITPHPSVKLVRIMLETSNLAPKCTNICSFTKKIPFSAKAVLILLMPAFFCKNQRFLVKIVLLLKAVM